MVEAGEQSNIVGARSCSPISRLSDAGSLAVGRVFQSEIEISVAERTVVLLPSGWHYITP